MAAKAAREEVCLYSTSGLLGKDAQDYSNKLYSTSNDHSQEPGEAGQIFTGRKHTWVFKSWNSAKIEIVISI